MGSKGQTYNTGRQKVGNQIVTSRGYSGGSELSELIGAKKVKLKK